MENNQQKNNIIDKVLAKIKKGDVKMKPKVYFVLKTILTIGGVFIIGAFALFLISFISFHLRASGVGYLPNFGFLGFGAYLRLLPWFLIIASVLLIILLEILAKHFAFVYRRPIFYSLLIIILIALVGGLVIDKTPFHSSLFLQARQGELPFAGPIYRDFGMPELRDVHRGVVSETTEIGFIMETSQGNELTVVINSETRVMFKAEIKREDTVVVFGKEEGGVINAIGVSTVDDNLKFPSSMRSPLSPPDRIPRTFK